MRKETLYIRILLTSICLWLAIITLKSYLKRTNKNPRLVKNNVKDNQSYAFTESKVHTGAMTKQEIRKRLGNSTWVLLHTMAATYPAFPTQEHKKDVLKFLILLTKVFPCGDCAKHMQKMFSDYPPRISSHDDFVQWLCECHNMVNERLKLPQFDCSKADEIWECGCEV
ncbi:Alr-like FAD-linked sulfhydryl oxidase [Hamiltosporidium tvaerminnensis]|uniref:Sulfhydryl oxidase n=3 Tax=Hamiltosporidium TaxID=1176354 RepID=A0A4Q9LL07_9MICR|nr:hypothetical protein LUQ84_001610 [Hamiltosporidium tvaerminnensis]TBT99197.1 Alr-like FAD-linked sulfhydryl oxidase [Hamiltosporidium tvaerminnensis]TBU02355.1 Alr-like FAD-linked sulfhydryl oxidase [Hamiltosporidium magnivora]TBU08586.1 Alr-like FAD-linked sulfhydryl oxidase [Hamiltosporidium tvaerminnensis]TBU15323.1 Alr-like FAD-linked sulfhydryl oxidase [Hamiltosporidium tvaerminnensis]